MATKATATCEGDWHDIIKAQFEVFIAKTERPPLGQWQDIGDGDALLIRNCARCGSTISDGTLRNGGRYGEEVQRAA